VIESLFIFAVLTSASALAEADAVSDEAHLHEIRVHGSESGALKKHEIIKTEVITREALEQKRAQTLAEAVANQSGVDAQNACANCGSKRLMINGLRGEHTTVLIDGIPMHSAVSSFYGMDAIPVVGIESIEVSRGAGASLIAPEAIGGVLNIITTKPLRTGMKIDSNVGGGGTAFLSALGSAISPSGKHRLVLAGQLSRQGHWDVDRNNVSEIPEMANHAFFLKGTSDLSSSDRLDVRYAKQSVNILGGTVNGTRPTTYLSTAAGTGSFQNDDVTQAFIGTQDQVTDVIGFSRQEGSVRWNHSFSSDVQFQLTGSAAEQFQNSLYMHGYDYNNRDLLLLGDARALFSIGDSHFFTLGVDLKNEEMAASSDALFRALGLEKDDFFYRSRAAYLQHVWLLSEGIELSSALRGDWMQVNFRSRTATEFDIDEVLLAPRVHLKVEHSPGWTSRLMYGRGYRPPLSFFESQHGLNEYGFTVQIDRIETSHGLGYSLSYDVPGFSVTGSSHHTWLSNMAFANGDFDGSPAVFQNARAEYKVWANDIVVSADLFPNWNVQLSFEHFAMQEDYKFRLPAAAIENRIRLASDWHFGNFEFINTFTLTGARNLSAYHYEQHYKNLHLAPDPNFPVVDEIQVFQNKGLLAPAFLTWDIYLGWKWKDRVTLFASVQNVLDFTQTGYGDSPLNWSSHGNDPLHYHLDNNHTWGPNRGRVFSVGLKAEI
jgi:outer membrane receptor for ferrienterochelin and colicins